MWRVVVGGEVVVGHPSTKPNSPLGRFVPFFVRLYVAQDFSF